MALCGCYQAGAAWYREAGSRKLAAGYYRALHRAILRDHTLRQVLYRCAGCHIFFLTYWSNARATGRTGFRCPMGCRDHYRRQRANKRSTAYYQTAEGKDKKKEQNARRTSCGGPPTEQAKADVRSDDCRMLRYLKYILERVDRRCVTAEEVRRLFAEIYDLLRQHSLENWWKLWHIRDG